MKKVSLLAASVALALVGCGGSDGGSDTNTGTPSAGGIIITGFDGYFKNAVVFDDVNNDGVLDVNVDTVFGLTKADGKITLPKGTTFQGSLALKTLKPGDTDKALAAKLAALSPAADSYSDFMNTYTTDMDHEGQPMANAVVFRAPVSAEDKTAVISPLTDLVAIEMAKGTAENPVSEEAAIAAVTAALGGTDEQPIDLFSDFVKDSKTNLESAKLHKTAQILTESKAKNPTAYEQNSAEIAAVAQEESEKIVTDETMGSDDLLNQKPVINPSAPTAPVVSNYKLLVNEDAKIAIQKEISALAITEGQSLNTTITIPAALFQDKYDNVQTNVQAVAEINGKGEITANLVGETLTLSTNNLQPTQDIYTITLKAEDKATANSEVLNTLSTTFSFKVELQNSAPVVDTDTQTNIQTLVDSWKMQQGAAFSQTFSVDGLFSDREGDALTYTTNINSVVPGLTSKFNKNTGEMTISGTPQPKNLGELAFTIIADDGHPATRLASTPASFTLPAIEAGEIAIDTNVKAELQAKATAWQLKVGNEFNQTLNISELFDSAVNGDVQYYANYAEHDNAPASNPINGVNITVDQSGLVTLIGTPTQVTNGVVLYLAQGINFSGGEDNDIESEMVLLNLPNVQPADETIPPVEPELGFTETHFNTNKVWKMGSFADRDGEIGHAMLLNNGQNLQFCWGSQDGADQQYASNISRWDQSAYTTLARLDTLPNYADYAQRDCWDVQLKDGKLYDNADAGETYVYEMLYQNKTANGDYQIILKINGDELFWMDSTDAPFAQSLSVSDKVADGKIEFDMTVESETVADESTKLYYAAGKFEYANAAYEYTSIMPEGFYTPGELEIDETGEHEMLILKETGEQSDYKTRYRYVNHNFGDFYVGIKWSEDSYGTSSPDFGLYSYSQEAMEKVVSQLPLLAD
ncbi:Ig domain-containing protein [Aliivibrio fischeri]|uniref:Ig domain-containing protein n=1 Tax=Aliivibrio fischeri TaxID=668 RepID=UPI003736E723